MVANLSEGSNRILVKLTDQVSLAGTDEDTVLLDTTAPVLGLRDGFGVQAVGPAGAGLPSTPAPIKVTISGTFLTPGSVPPIFPVLAEWNLVGLHSENVRNVGNFLDSLVFPSSGAKAWSSLLEFLNVVSFNFAPEEGSEDERITITLGAFNSLDTSNSAQLGRGF